MEDLETLIVKDLETAGKKSLYKTDADESDPRYKAYGVRSPQLKTLVKKHRKAVQKLDLCEQIDLATRLIDSGFGEQQSFALSILISHSDYFVPERFADLDNLIRKLHGWSKIDSFTGSLLRDVLYKHPIPFTAMVEEWNRDSDMWLRRASVVLFTRKVAESGKYNDFALSMCERLKHAPEDLVRKGVGWSLKDLMRSDKQRVLEYVLDLNRQGISKTITSYAIRDLKGQERADFLTTR